MECFAGSYLDHTVRFRRPVGRPPRTKFFLIHGVSGQFRQVCIYISHMESWMRSWISSKSLNFCFVLLIHGIETYISADLNFSQIPSCITIGFLISYLTFVFQRIINKNDKFLKSIKGLNFSMSWKMLHWYSSHPDRCVCFLLLSLS